MTSLLLLSEKNQGDVNITELSLFISTTGTVEEFFSNR